MKWSEFLVTFGIGVGSVFDENFNNLRIPILTGWVNGFESQIVFSADACVVEIVLKEKFNGFCNSTKRCKIQRSELVIILSIHICTSTN